MSLSRYTIYVQALIHSTHRCPQSMPYAQASSHDPCNTTYRAGSSALPSHLLPIMSTSSQHFLPHLRHNHHPNTPRLPHHTPRHALQAQPTQPRLAMLDLRNLIHMLETNRAHSPLHRIAHRRTTRARLSLLPVVVVHRPWHISSTSYFVLRGEHAGGGEEESCCGRRA